MCVCGRQLKRGIKDKKAKRGKQRRGEWEQKERYER